MPKAILHIGLAKTGTTFLQNWLRYNSFILRQAGFHVAPDMASHQVAGSLVQDVSRRAMGDIIFLANLPDQRETLFSFDLVSIISSEFFYICNPLHVAEYFKKEGVDVVMIVCVLRRQDILAASGYAQDVKSLGRSDIVTGAAYFPYLDWNCLYESWAGAFPDAAMRMINYSPRSLLSAFKMLLGIGIDTIDQVQEIHTNRSLNAEMTEVARMLNERGLPPMSEALLALQRNLPGPPFGLPPYVVRQFEDAYLGSNRRLAERLQDPEFEEMSRPGWNTDGVCMAGQIDDARFAEIIKLAGREGGGVEYLATSS
ncbi:hypothetical protein MesoLj131c_22200 [Mesorhizobium sp. 131-3-5]|uniref:hypothetical protein n=1 Tax=Mesorhizobium sp. 131-3-5 TaxID=2744520 RepID=UPI001926F669|nr:hypothetical protein [Mesorhizobium sp. 131-3-5]BCH07962.1 hypothetical protein MesoLj131c_22200 [Mesorhizobium sp. 131-3-5]